MYTFFLLQRLKMFLRLTPIKLRLYALITLEINLPFLPLPLKYTLLKAKLWEYQTATIRKLLIDNTKAEEDKSPPKLESFGVRRFLAISVIQRNLYLKKKVAYLICTFLFTFIHLLFVLLKTMVKYVQVYTGIFFPVFVYHPYTCKHPLVKKEICFKFT